MSLRPCDRCHTVVQHRLVNSIKLVSRPPIARSVHYLSYMPILDVKMSDQSAPIFVVDVGESRIAANISKPQEDSTTERLQGETFGQLFSRSLSISESHSLEKYPKKVVYKSQVSLSNLPNDLLLRIFSLCEARTISKLRRCCKGFYQLSTEQVVWLSVLKRTCIELNLPIPSFPESAFSNSDIELLATAWIRFESVLRQAKDGQPLPHKMVHLLDINVEGPILSFDQSPDGRFLFVVQTVGIRVWSLQTPSPTLVASFELEIPGDCWKNLCVGTESNNSYLMYLLVSTRSHGLNEWLCLRFKYPMGEHRETGVELLSQLDRLRFSARRWHSWSTSLTAPLLITCFDHSSGGKYYLVWDPVANSCVTWSADVKDTSTNPIVLFASDFIIAIDEVSQAMVVYPLPEMPPKRSYDPQVSAQLYNPALLCTPEETKELNRSETFTMYWKTLPNRGHLASSHDGWASLHDTGEKDWLLERFEIFHADPSSSTFTPLPLKCERSYSRHPHSLLIGEGWSATLDVSSDQTILLHTTSKERMQVIFHLSSPDEDNGGIELGRGILYDSNSGFQGDTKHYSLCPFAGRMCVSAPRGIKVVDFVEMPYMKE